VMKSVRAEMQENVFDAGLEFVAIEAAIGDHAA